MTATELERRGRLRGRILGATDRGTHRHLVRAWAETYDGPAPTLNNAVGLVTQEADVVLDAVLAHDVLAPALACQVTEAIGMLAAALAVVPGGRARTWRRCRRQ
ncbi:hypothetical protein ACF08W_31340 [Streptomyces sp. NPDC015144]|uniref:hypothetical protein n=1 Tax=Streptomyces sp. NPDC015144 TaxID=3364944 RepID=UPI0036F62F4A